MYPRVLEAKVPPPYLATWCFHYFSNQKNIDTSIFYIHFQQAFWCFNIDLSISLTEPLVWNRTVFQYIQVLDESESGQMMWEKWNVHNLMYIVYLSQTMWNHAKKSTKNRPTSLTSHWTPVEMVHNGPRLCKHKCVFLCCKKILRYPKTQGKIDLRNESGRPMKVKVVGEVSEKWN